MYAAKISICPHGSPLFRLASNAAKCGDSGMLNVVMIMADQLRYDALGCTGNPLTRTPTLDGISRRGVCFLQHFTPNQMCSASRATIFSGLYPRHHGLHRNGI